MKSFILAVQPTSGTAWLFSIPEAIGHPVLFQAPFNILYCIPTMMLSLLSSAKSQHLLVNLTHLLIIRTFRPEFTPTRCLPNWRLFGQIGYFPIMHDGHSTKILQLS